MIVQKLRMLNSKAPPKIFTSKLCPKPVHEAMYDQGDFHPSSCDYKDHPPGLLGLLSIQTPSCFSILFNNVFRSWHLKIIDALPLSKGKWRADPATGIGVQLWGAPSWRGAPTQPVLRSMCHVARLEQCWSLSSPGRALCFLHLQQGKKKPQGGGRGRAMTWWLGRGGTQQPRPKLGKLGPPAGTGWGPDSKLEKIYIWAKMFFL